MKKAIVRQTYFHMLIEAPLKSQEAPVASPEEICRSPQRKNWQLIDTIDGAKASAIAYSIAETAKANHLKPYEYYKHLLSIIPKHMDDKD